MMGDARPIPKENGVNGALEDPPHSITRWRNMFKNKLKRSQKANVEIFLHHEEKDWQPVGELPWNSAKAWLSLGNIFEALEVHAGTGHNPGIVCTYHFGAQVPKVFRILKVHGGIFPWN